MFKYRRLLEGLIRGLIILAITIPVVLAVLSMRGNNPGLVLAGQISAFIFAAFFALGIFNTITGLLGVRDSFFRQYLLTERGNVQREHNRAEKLERAFYFFSLGIPALVFSLIINFF